MNSISKTHKVLIVGAGPVGLTLALMLRQYGIQSHLIDKIKERSHFSKALTITSASLKIFQGLQIAERMLEKGKKCEYVEIIFNGDRTAFIDKSSLPSQFNYYLSIPQPTVENILESELHRWGGEVQYGHELISLEDKNNYVSVDIVDSSKKSTNTLHFDYVIGCDGAHSSVRKLLNIPFMGPDYPVHFLLADVKFKENNPPSCASYYVTSTGFLGLFPTQTDYVRVVVSKEGRLPDNRTQSSLEEIQCYLDKYLNKLLTASTCIWSTHARIIGRIADQCRLNRIFLAGDAWHLFSPVGGQSLNTGLQDAFDLGWKLAYVIQKKFNKTLFNTYEDCRMVAAKKVLALTDRYTNLIVGYNKDEDLKEYFKPVFQNRIFFKKLLPYFFSGYHADWSVEKSNWVGKHIPFIKLNNQDGIHSTYDLPKFRIYVLIIQNNLSSVIEEFSTNFYKKILKIITVNIWDAELKNIFTLRQQIIFLVSPGGYIVAYGDKEQVRAYFENYMISE